MFINSGVNRLCLFRFTRLFLESIDFICNKYSAKDIQNANFAQMIDADIWIRYM